MTKTSRALLAALLAFSPLSASAASLYRGLSRGSAVPPAGPAAVLAAATLEIPAVAPASPEAAASLEAASVSPAAAVGAPSAEAASAAEASARTEPPRAAGASKGDDDAAQEAALLFDIGVARAVRLFHPSLPVNVEPAVAARAGSRAQGAVPSDDELQARMRLSPLTNPEREAAVVSLYRTAGAANGVVDVPAGQAPRLDLYDTVQRQDAGEDRHNLIVVKKGRTDRVIVVGAHHDKVEEGAGTIDNWTGATMVTNLYQAMKDVETDATIVFVAFAREEEGLLGSRRFVTSLPQEALGRIDSMINLDTLGVDGTFSWGNNSTRSLLDLVQQVAAAEKRDLREITLWGGDADSSTFRDHDIAAVTLFGASPDVIWDIIHSAADTIAAFSLPHYRNAYLLTLAFIKALDKQPVKAPGGV